MTGIAQAILPVTLIVGLGWVLSRIGLLKPPEWAPIERLVYFVTFPSLLFSVLSGAEFRAGDVLALAFVLIAVQMVMWAIASAIRVSLKLEGPVHTSLVQGIVRLNTYIALAMAPGLFGAQGLALVAIAFALMVPFGNVVAVIELARFGGNGRADAGTILKSIVTNPLIIACAAGMAWNTTGLVLPQAVETGLSILGQATLALGLLAVGAGLKPLRAVGNSKVLVLAIGLQLVIKPWIGLAFALPIGLGQVEIGVIVLSLAVPTAASSYILSKLMGGDADLMAAIITGQTLVAVATMPLILLLVG